MLPTHVTEGLREKFKLHYKRISREYVLPDATIDWDKVYADLGINETNLPTLLVKLVSTNLDVAAAVQRAVLSFAFGKAADPTHLSVLDSAPVDEMSWIFADHMCETCPGSQSFEFLPGKSLPMCASTERLEKWNSCLKYRENLIDAKAVLTDAERQDIYQKLDTLMEAALGTYSDSRYQEAHTGDVGPSASTSARGDDAHGTTHGGTGGEAGSSVQSEGVSQDLRDPQGVQEPGPI